MTDEIMNSQENANTGSKTNLLIVGAIILLLIGGAVVFSQNQNKMSGSTETAQETTSMETTTAPAGSTEDEDALLTQGEMALDSTTTTTTTAATGDAMMAETEVRTIQVEAGAFYYKPTSITVKKGEKVKIVMTSKDMMHDFNIDELGVKLPITKSGETNSVEFTATKVGTFEYYCSVGQHRKNGQVGTLIILE